MIHRITIHFLIRNHYSRRLVFPRYCGLSTTTHEDLSVKVSTDELRAIVEDAEVHALVGTSYPNLALAYGRLARKGREQLKYDDTSYTGPDLKSQAAGEKQED